MLRWFSSAKASICNCFFGSRLENSVPKLGAGMSALVRCYGITATAGVTASPPGSPRCSVGWGGTISRRVSSHTARRLCDELPSANSCQVARGTFGHHVCTWVFLGKCWRLISGAMLSITGWESLRRIHERQGVNISVSRTYDFAYWGKSVGGNSRPTSQTAQMDDVISRAVVLLLPSGSILRSYKEQSSEPYIATILYIYMNLIFKMIKMHISYIHCIYHINYIIHNFYISHILYMLYINPT